MSDPFDLDEAETARRLDFIGFEEEDAERIRACRDLLAPHAGELAEDLYARIQTIPALGEILEGHLSQCKTKQATYLRQLLDARVDRLYTASRTWIGEVHRHMGVEPRWYLAAYCFLQEQIAERLEAGGLDPTTAWRAHRSLIKLVVFDAILALDAYHRTTMETEHRREEALRENALPVLLEVEEGVLLLPVAGSVDSERATQLEGAILQALLSSKVEARALVVEGSRLWPELESLRNLRSALSRGAGDGLVALAGLCLERDDLLASAKLDEYPSYPTLAAALEAVRSRARSEG